MSEFPSVEADELVTKQFLRAELAERMNRQTVTIVGLIVAVTAMIEALTALV